MKAISLWQPWATLVALGLKRFETRSWEALYRGPLAIHAAQRKLTRIERALAYIWGCNGHLHPGAAERFIDSSIPFGAIIAVVDLEDCLPTEDVLIKYPDEITRSEEEFGDFRSARFAWKLGHLRAIDPPIPFRGRQGFFDVPDELLPLLS